MSDRRTSAISRPFALFVVVSSACGGDAEPCTTDDTCPAFYRCIEQECRPLATRDAGPRRDSGSVVARDGGGGDNDANGPMDGGMPGGVGRVTVFSADDPTGSFGWFAFAEFVPAGTAECLVDRDEFCVYRDCAVAGVLPHAGAIRITGETGGGGELLPDTTGLYAGSGTDPLWYDGGALVVTAIGDDVPSFDLSVVAPLRADLQDGMLGGVPIRDVLLLRFFPPGTPTFVVVDAMAPVVFLVRDLRIDRMREVRCDFPAGSSMMEIPFVDSLRPASSALVATGTIASETRTVSGWAVTVEAIHVADYEGMPAAAVVRLD